MKVTVGNLGILKKAEFEVGDLTIICGANNTGKTYASYALYGFINFWKEVFAYDFLGREAEDKLFENGSVKIDVEAINKNIDEIIKTACNEYCRHLPRVFAAPDKYFANTEFSVSLSENDVNFAEIEKTMQFTSPSKKPVFNLLKKHGEPTISINILAAAEQIDEISKDLAVYQINLIIKDLLFGTVFPKPFIASTERTGAAIFMKELDFSRNRLIEQVSNRDKDIDPVTLFNTYYDKGYALPVKDDVDFIRGLENVVKYESSIAKNSPDILKSFGSVLGGTYKASKEGLYYLPDKGNVKLTMGESASSVRSLLNIGIYLSHIARPGDILIIDEPELNLHPMNQRLMARLFAKMVNAGIRVFITTHSDYILKEFNTLIMLNRADSTAVRVMEKYRYEDNELLDKGRVRAYVAERALVSIEGASRRQTHNTFVKAPINEHGIEISNFDETINEMNDIQDAILFGGCAE